jgi:hypothetical protein
MPLRIISQPNKIGHSMGPTKVSRSASMEAQHLHGISLFLQNTCAYRIFHENSFVVFLK